MIFLSICTTEGPQLAIKAANGILRLKDLFELFGEMPSPPLPKTLTETIADCAMLAQLRSHVADILNKNNDFQSLLLAESSVEITLPFRPRKIICVGLNYKDHAIEVGLQLPPKPLLFAKLPSSVIGPNESILLPEESVAVDYEAELAVVIGRHCHHASPSDALSYVAGYTCLNDVSARDLQRNDGQWLRAKSLDTFCPIGPYLVTADEIPNPQALSISCLVNGELRQNSNTGQMIFPVSELIAFISRSITLDPGDVISTGTPNGVGSRRTPPVYLKHDDEVVVEIEHIGCLANIVKNKKRSETEPSA